jgi:hypothetical protein
MSESFSDVAKGGGSDDGKPAFESPFAKPEDHAATAMPDASAFAAQFANPSGWWNTVQDQFAKAVGSAMTPPEKPARKRSAPAAKKRSTSPRKTSPKKK